MMSGRVLFTNCFKVLSVFRCPSKKSCISWSQIKWCLLHRQKTQSIISLQQACSLTTGVHVEYGAKSGVTHKDDCILPADLVKVKAVLLNLTEGGKNIITILNNTSASVVRIYVRTSVLAKELVKELKENHFNAEVVDETLKFDVNEAGQRIFVVSDKVASTVNLPHTDLLIQVQAPLNGFGVMKQRLHVSNFTNTQAEAVLMYNTNDVNLIAQLGEIVEGRNVNTLTQLPPVKDTKVTITSKDEENLPSLHVNVVNHPAVSRKVKTTLFKPVYPRDKIKNTRTSFVDRVRLYVIAGTGGNGSPRTGARGGDGGDVILECHSRATLRHFRFKENRRPKAGHGQHCCTQAKRVNGQRGIDVIVPIPLGTVVKDEKTGHVIADMHKIGQQVKVVNGGRGGSSMTSAGGGEKGERRMLILEYKMYTDIGLVGFPNAGKSTLLRAISNAKPSIAEYAFTSLSPTLGRMQFDDFNQLSVVDLPGLIEGAHQNKGLGLKFLRHVERATMLMFVVDINGFQLSSKNPKRTAFETICLLAKELLLYREDLQNKPKILVVNKMDCDGADYQYRIFKEKIAFIQQDEVSTIKELVERLDSNENDIKNVMAMLNDINCDHILAVSALNHTGVDKILSKIQQMMSELNKNN